MTIQSNVNLPSLEAQRNYWNDRWSRNRGANYFQSTRSAAVAALIRELPLKNPHSLDYGCGTGFFTAELAKLGTAVGVDLSETAIDEARRRYPEPTYVAANLFELGVSENEFDLVVSQEVIAHVSDQKEYVARITRMLKPGGYLVVTTANPIVMHRLSDPPLPDAHIHQWLNLRDVRRLLGEKYDILKHMTIMPRGDRGFLRIVNSPLLHAVLWRLFTDERVQRFKERIGLGYTIIVVARLREGK